jgi:hypothetical protein
VWLWCLNECTCQSGIVSAQDQAALERWDALLTATDDVDDAQFEDAEDEDELEDAP